LPDPRLRRDAAGNVECVRRVAGHGLRANGEPYLAADCYFGRCATNVGGTTHQENTPTVDSVRGAGHAVCECGVLSPHDSSGASRRRWHRAHKARVILGQLEPRIGPRPVDPAAIA
jgi:hypothetical protein